jgi:large subunit ribosomal protein L18
MFIMKINRLQRRHYNIRKRISGTAARPRLCVKRSNKYIYAILVDDSINKVICQISSLNKDLPADVGAENKESKDKKRKITGKSLKAFQVGYALAQKAKSLGISQVVFDRAGYRYHGRVKALAEGARKGGLVF